MADELNAEAASEPPARNEGETEGGVVMPKAAKVPRDVSELDTTLPERVPSDAPPDRTSKPGPRSLVPLPEGYATKARSSIPPGRLRRSSDPSRPRLTSDPAGRSSSPDLGTVPAPVDLAATQPEAGLTQGHVPERPRLGGQVVTPMRIIEVKRAPGPAPATQQSAATGYPQGAEHADADRLTTSPSPPVGAAAVPAVHPSPIPPAGPSPGVGAPRPLGEIAARHPPPVQPTAEPAPVPAQPQAPQASAGPGLPRLETGAFPPVAPHPLEQAATEISAEYEQVDVTETPPPVAGEDPAPFDPAPFDPAPFEAASFETAPFEAASFETAPLETAPLETAPLETAPLETAPLETAPLETAPFDPAPLEGAPPVAAPHGVASETAPPGIVPPGARPVGLPGMEAPTPPDTPASRSMATGADAPTPPETPALRREMIDSFKEYQAALDSGMVPATQPSGSSAAGEAARSGPPAPPVRSTPRRSTPSEEEIDITVEPPDAFDSISEEELTEVEAISERELDDSQRRRRLPPRPPPRTTFTGEVDEGKRRQWWEELWNEDFLRAELEPTPREVHEEANFIERSLAVERGGVILDLACGAGAYSVEIARRGYAVVGYDLSASQLARAGALAQRNEQKVGFLQGDVREMALEQMFDGIFCWNASFGFFEEEKNQAVLANVHKALKPGGSFLLDVPNRDFVVRQQPMQNWFEGDGCVCMDDMHVDFITSRLSVKRTVMLDDGRNREWFYSVRLYSLHELGRMLHEVGFRVAQVSGQPATVGGFLGCYSPRMMILAVKPAD